MFGVSLRAALGAAGAAAAVPSGYVALVQALAPRAWWRLGEAAGVGAADQRGLAPGLYVGGVTLGRPAVVDDPDDGAVRLDGQSGRVEVPHVAALAPAAGTFAVAVLAENAQAVQGVWSKGADAEVAIDGNRIRYRLGGQTLHKGTVFVRRRVHLAWSFGPRGMRLYVDGVLVASNAHTGGLAGNGAGMLWGARSGPAGHLAGTLDEAVFFDRQLTDTELRPLARLSRALPTHGTLRYVATNGNDSAAGTLAQPWRTVAKAFASVNPGDVVVLRGGTYWERGLVCNRSGTATNPITLMAHPGETPVIDGGYPFGRSVGNSDWTLVDAGRGTWEGPAVGAPSAIMGRFRNGASGRWYVLFSAIDQGFFDQTGNAYRGPSCIGANGRVRVRMGKPSTAISVEPAEAPDSADPRQNVVEVYPMTRLIDVTADHYVWDGITFQNGEPLFEIRDRSHHGFFRCRFAVGLFSVTLRGARFLLFDDCEADGGWADWLLWGDIKHGSMPGSRMKSCWIIGHHQSPQTNDIEIRNCLLRNLFDGVILGRSHSRNFHMHHNTCDYIRDDTCQNKHTMVNVEFAYNFVNGVGYSWNGSGGTSSSDPGKIWIHHNVKINTKRVVWTTSEPFVAHAPVSTHQDGGYGSGAPFKLYHNTVVARMPNRDLLGTQFQYLAHGNSNNTGIPHEVYNNILVTRTDGGEDQDHILRGVKVLDGSQIFDGNLLWRARGGSVNNNYMMRFYKDSNAGGNFKTFNSLAAFKADSWFNGSKAYYPPGMHAADQEADPGFVDPRWDDPAAGDWRPTQNHAGLVGLAGKTWPGIDPAQTWRGALDPNGDGSEVGRQPPV